MCISLSCNRFQDRIICTEIFIVFMIVLVYFLFFSVFLQNCCVHQPFSDEMKIKIISLQDTFFHTTKSDNVKYSYTLPKPFRIICKELKLLIFEIIETKTYKPHKLKKIH